MGPWRIVAPAVADATEQLARSDALWRSVAAGDGRPVLRWYRYPSPAVVLGVGQAYEAVDAVAAAAAGMQVVKRTSGGTAVLADETMLALDVALPAGAPGAGPDVLEAYAWVGERFRVALAELAPGAAEALRLTSPAEARADQAAQRAAAPDSAEALRGLACFGTLSPYEVVVAGDGARPDRKLVGLSQVRKRGVVLVQAGLYATVRAGRLAAALALSDDRRRRLAAELPRRMAGLDTIGLAAIAPDTVSEAVVEAVSRAIVAPAVTA